MSFVTILCYIVIVFILKTSSSFCLNEENYQCLVDLNVRWCHNSIVSFKKSHILSRKRDNEDGIVLLIRFLPFCQMNVSKTTISVAFNRLFCLNFVSQTTIWKTIIVKHENSFKL